MSSGPDHARAPKSTAEFQASMAMVAVDVLAITGRISRWYEL